METSRETSREAVRQFALKRGLASAAIFAQLCLALSLASCSSAKKNPATGETPGADGAPVSTVPFGPPVPQERPAYGPEPVLLRPAVLVLGPGLARGYSYVGVLRAMKDAKIPVGAILGCEMGSLVGALYAMDGNFNHLEWALQRFRDDVFTGRGDLLPSLFKKLGSGGKLSSALEKTFGHRDIADAKIPLRIMIQPKGSQDPVILEKGEVVPALRAALADPELLEPGTWNGEEAISAKAVEPYLLKEARSLGIGPVIWVDAGARPSTVGPSSDVDLIIRPNLNGIDRKDFAKRNSAVFRGKMSLKGQLPRLRTLVGLPPQPSDSGTTQPEVTQQ